MDADGPFLAVPALKRAVAAGDAAARQRRVGALKDAKPAFEKAWERLGHCNRDDPRALDRYREARDAWVDMILRDVLGWRRPLHHRLHRGSVRRGGQQVRSPNHAVAVRPTGALVHGGAIGALVLRHRPGRLAA